MIKKYVVSLELAKRMEELGWNKETYFCWIKISNAYNNQDYDWRIWSKEKLRATSDVSNETYPAPLFAEIWEELPMRIVNNGTIYYKRLQQILINDSIWNRCKYVTIDELKQLIFKDGEVPAKAAGELWSWLVENKYLEV